MRSTARRTLSSSIWILSLALIGCGTSSTDQTSAKPLSENESDTSIATNSSPNSEPVAANRGDRSQGEATVAATKPEPVTRNEGEREAAPEPGVDVPQATLENLLTELDGGRRISMSQSQQLVDLSTEDPENPLVVKAARLVLTDMRSPNWNRIQVIGELLIRHHLDSSELPGMCMSFYRVNGGEHVLKSIADKSPNDETRFTAKYWLGYRLKDQPERMELMREVADYAGDLPYRNSTLQARAAGHLNATNLVVGKVAPDMIGHDIDGESFRLSDYRGKIVLLDFWGDW